MSDRTKIFFLCILLFGMYGTYFGYQYYQQEQDKKFWKHVLQVQMDILKDGGSLEGLVIPNE